VKIVWRTEEKTYMALGLSIKKVTEFAKTEVCLKKFGALCT